MSSCIIASVASSDQKSVLKTNNGTVNSQKATNIDRDIYRIRQDEDRHTGIQEKTQLDV